MKISISAVKALAVIETVKEFVPVFVSKYKEEIPFDCATKDLEEDTNSLLTKCHIASAVISSGSTITTTKGPFLIQVDKESVTASLSDESVDKGIAIGKVLLKGVSGMFITSIKEVHNIGVEVNRIID